MAIFCIPQKYIEKLKTSALAKEVDLNELYKMDSKERREFFSKFTDKEIGKFINTKFEQAIVSKQQNAILDWAQSVFTPKQKQAVRYKNVLDKVKALEDLGMLNGKAENAFLEDLVMDKLGISVTAEEMQSISEKATKVEEAQKVVGTNLGNPAYTKENLDFFKALKEINDYMQSINPAGRLAVGMGTIGRGMMLFSIKSPILNIGSNIEIGVAEALTRRIASGKVKGANNKAALDYIKLANTIYTKTGFDISRMTGIKDYGAAGERVLGETVHAQGKGKTRALGRLVEDIVFKNLMGAPDAAFASVQFADSLNLNARQLTTDAAQAEEFMRDAMRIEPTTDEGKMLRAQAILDAEVATWTNETWASKISLGIRKLFNEASGDLRIGDYLMPFVKTPANVIATSLDYAGLGFPKALYKFGKMLRNGTWGSDKSAMQSMFRDLVRAGLGFTAAAILAANVDDEDYVGAYDPARAQLEKGRNSVENSFRIGDKWISTDWLGPISVPFNGIMHAKKYGKMGAGESAFQYGAGTLGTTLQIPGVADALELLKYQQQNKDMTLEEMTGEAGAKIIGDLQSRLIPSFVSDVAKSLDSSERRVDGPIEGVMSKTPVLRNILPEKRNIFGEAVPTEGPVSTILFGSRVKTSMEDSVLTEINRVVNETEKNVNFTDWSKSSSKKLAQFRDKVGETKYEKATIEYGKTLKNDLKTLFKSAEYKNMDVDKQLNAINGLDTKVQEKVFEKYNFTYKTKKK